MKLLPFNDISGELKWSHINTKWMSLFCLRDDTFEKRIETNQTQPRLQTVSGVHFYAKNMYELSNFQLISIKRRSLGLLPTASNALKSFRR